MHRLLNAHEACTAGDSCYVRHNCESDFYQVFSFLLIYLLCSVYNFRQILFLLLEEFVQYIMCFIVANSIPITVITAPDVVYICSLVTKVELALMPNIYKDQNAVRKSNFIKND